jgi:hypothetical protein
MGIAVIVAKETDRYISRLKERRPVMKIIKSTEGEI